MDRLQMMSWQQCKIFNLLCHSDVIWRRRSQCLSYWLVAWQYNTISWINTDLQSMGFCGKQQSGLLRSAHELITYHVLEIILQQITLYLPGASDLDIKACACCRRCHVCFPSSEFCRTPHIPVRLSVCGIFIITSDHFVRNSEIADRFDMVLIMFKMKDNNIKGNLMKCKSIGRHRCTYGIY